MKTVAIIPARGGSKGLPRKNVRMLAGKPLIVWTIEDAVEARCVDEVYVSTDDPEIGGVAAAAGAKIIHRPSSIAGDKSSSEEALLHAVDNIDADSGKVDAAVFLQATSPIRTGADIDSAMDLFRKAGADSLLSVCPMHMFIWTEKDGEPRSLSYDYHRRPLRQEMEPQFRENGSIYVFKPEILRKYKNRLGGKIVLFKMGEDANLDIDSEEDFRFAELHLSGRKAGPA